MSDPSASEEPLLRYRGLVEEAHLCASKGDVEEAINRIRDALDLASNPHVISTLDHHLQLPLLLQRAGRLEEAREEFRRLLADGYTGQLDNPSVQWVERGLIYAAMRRAFVREERPAEASLYGGLAYLAEGYSRFLDSSRDEKELKEGFMSEATAKAVTENMVGRLEEVSTEELAADQIADLLVRTIRRFGDVDPEELFEQVERHLRRQLFGRKD